MGHFEWRKSTYSAVDGDCVEVADVDGGYRAVRDSKDPAGPVLEFMGTEWSEFISGVCAGEF